MLIAEYTGGKEKGQKCIIVIFPAHLVEGTSNGNISRNREKNKRISSATGKTMWRNKMIKVAKFAFKSLAVIMKMQAKHKTGSKLLVLVTI